MKESIEQNLKRIRKSKGLTQDNLAYELDITKGAYSKIENGQTSVTIKRLYEIADILEVNITEFFKEKTSENKVEDPQKNYGFATKSDIEEVVKMIQELAKQISDLKATQDAKSSYNKRTKK